MSVLSMPNRDKLETLIVRGLGALPPKAQFMLAGGRPIRIDGQQLDPEVQLTLMLLKLSGRPSAEGVPGRGARGETRRKAKVYSGAPLPIAEVRPVEVPGADGPLQARLYV